MVQWEGSLAIEKPFTDAEYISMVFAIKMTRGSHCSLT